MRKYINIVSIILGGFAILLLVVWGIAYLYFVSHKKELIKEAGLEIGKKIKASVQVKDAGISFFSSFPSLSIDLKNVRIIDTSFSKHPVPFLEAGKFSVSSNLFQLLKGNIHLSRIALTDGVINFYRDTTGVSNLSILDENRGPKKESRKPKETLFNLLVLDNIRVLITDKTQYRNIDLIIRHLSCQVSLADSTTIFNINMNTHINFVGFYIIDGYYGKGKELNGSFPLTFNSITKAITLSNISLLLNQEPVQVDGVFHLDAAQLFHLHVMARSISYENASTSMLEKTRVALANFTSKKPLNIDVKLSGNTKYLSIPHVYMTWNVADDDVSVSGIKLSHCSFSGTFINDVNQGMLRNDSNSRITLTGFNANWNGKSEIHFNKVVVTNLLNPLLYFDLHAHCKLTDIDSLVQSDDLNLEEGNAEVDLVYNGPLKDSAHIVPDITGEIALNNAEILYVPRNMRLVKCNAMIKFNHKEISIDNLSGKLGSSSVVINGHINSFAPIFSHNGNEIALQWVISSPLIDLTQLIPFIGGRKPVHRSLKTQHIALAGVSHIIDSIVEKCSVHATFIAKRIIYKHFEADNLNADLVLVNQMGWAFRNLSLNYAGGKIALKGSMNQTNDDRHKVSVKVQISKVDVSTIFYGFDNFGMVSFDHTNLKGTVSLKSTLNLELDNSANIIPNTLKGNADFELEKGELINFKPIEEICAKIFPKRNFKDIQFAVLKDQFTVENYKITMHKMEISSNILHMYVDGVYALKGNVTNMTIQVPLNNLLKPDFNKAPKNQGVNAKTGPSVYVHAIDDGKGNINFKYNFSGKK